MRHIRIIVTLCVAIRGSARPASREGLNMDVQTRVYSGPPIVAALAAGLHYANQNGIQHDGWALPSPTGERDLSHQVMDLSAIESVLPPGALIAVADKDPKVINGKLEKAGFGIRVPETTDVEFAACGILSLLGQWLYADYYFGPATIRLCSGGQVPGVKASSQQILGLHDRQAIRLRFGERDPMKDCTIWLVPLLDAGDNPLELGTRAVAAFRAEQIREGKVEFPKVHLLHTRRIEEIIGAYMQGTDISINAAQQETELAMDENGLKLRSGAAYSATRSAGGQGPMRIDGPFAIVVTVTWGSEKRELVLGHAVIGTDGMRDPKAGDPLKIVGNAGFISGVSDPLVTSARPEEGSQLPQPGPVTADAGGGLVFL
ncbi:MAG: hypothetical protein KC653_00240 [Candidatus Andersenbacteria bacterium]|nr:hypothetical protein [Candidatus Andersenbacteria bacterium]